MDEHPVIQIFRTQANLLDIAGDKSSLDDAIVKLAGWIGLSKNLSEDDIAILANIGGILFRDGMARRTHD